MQITCIIETKYILHNTSTADTFFQQINNSAEELTKASAFHKIRLLNVPRIVSSTILHDLANVHWSLSAPGESIQVSNHSGSEGRVNIKSNYHQCFKYRCGQEHIVDGKLYWLLYLHKDIHHPSRTTVSPHDSQIWG